MTTELVQDEKTLEFIRKARLIHGDTYGYSKSVYKGAKTYLIIECFKHGDFNQKPDNHITGKGQGCPKCIGRHKTTEDVIHIFRTIHGDRYDYSKTIFFNNKTNMEIICKEHGSFYQSFSNHSRGQGCSKCVGLAKPTTQEWIERANKIHHGLYLYDKVIYINAHTKVIITCKKHGDFLQTPDKHLQGCGCPNCRSSRGELEIKNILEDRNIIFEKEKRFPNCRNERSLPFDFYLPDYNLCIEYQGQQHFAPVPCWGKSKRLDYTKNNDNIKREFCKDNNIGYLEICYWDDIADKVSKNIN
jgi:hypothetical protein